MTYDNKILVLSTHVDHRFFFLLAHLANTRYTLTAIRVYVTPSSHRCPCGSGKVPKYSATNSARGCEDEFRLKYTCVFLSCSPPVPSLHHACPIRRIVFLIFFFQFCFIFFQYRTLKIDISCCPVT